MLLIENPLTCKEQIQLYRDMFVALVNLMVERNPLSHAKGVSYRDASDRFKHSLLTICLYFHKDVIGAIDGTHIEASVNDAKGNPFFNRKGAKSWNILVACSFDRMYTFVNLGWEGKEVPMMLQCGKFY
ncbi:putative nuclease HARBI1 [Bienertia sinuspersici]